MPEDRETISQSPEPIPETEVIKEESKEAVLKEVPQEVPIEIAEETPESLTVDQLNEIPPTPPASNNRRLYMAILFAGIFFIFFFILIFKGLLSFIGGGSNKKVELVYWGLWEDESVMAPLIADYEQEHKNVKIEYSQQEPQSYREKLVARIGEGRGPDIFRFHNTWLPSIAQSVAPLPQDLMTSEKFEKTFLRSVSQDLKIDDKYYGLPLEIDGLVLLYNEDLFKAAGLNGPPKTWNDVVTMAGNLLVADAEGNIVTSGIAMGTANNIEHFAEIFGTLLLQNGGSLNNLGSNEAVEALRFYRSFAEPPTALWDESMPNNLNAFITGKVGMIFVPTWQILTIKAANPDLKIKTATMPVLPGSALNSISSYWVEGVSRASKKQNEAWKFLIYLTEKEQMTRLYEQEVKQGRLFGEPYSRVDLKSTLIDDPYLGALMEQGESMHGLPLVSRTYDNGLNDKIISYIADAINATSQGESYESALQTAGRGVTQVLKQFSIE